MAQYYIDTSSTGSGDGTTTATTGANAAWVAFSEITGEAAGDTISLNKGDEWRETLTVGTSGSSGSPITFNTYGSGADPIINGSDLVGTWTAASGWSTDYDATVGAAANGSDDRQRRNVWSCTTTGTKVRVTLKAGGAQSDIDGTSVGPRSGSTDDFSAAPTRITWDTGSNTTSIASGATKVSDDITFTCTTGNDYLIHIFWDDTYSYAYGTGNAYAQSGAGQSDETLTQVINYGTIQTNVYAVDAVEVYENFPNVWQAACTTEPNAIWLNGTKGTKVASIAACNSTNEWYWTGNVLYVYSTSDPDTAFTTPGIESATRNSGILVSGTDYITVDGITCEKTKSYGGILVWTGADNCIVENCTLKNNGAQGVWFTSDTGHNNIIRNNTINNNVWGINSGQHAGQSGSETLIQSNTVHTNENDGIHIRSNYWIVESNTVYGNGTALDDYHNIHVYSGSSGEGTGDNHIFRYNLVYSGSSKADGSLGGGGILVDQWCDDIQIYYNACYDNDRYGIGVYDGDSPLIYNNVCYKNLQNCNNATFGEITLLGSVSDLTDNVIVKNNITTADTGKYAISVGSNTYDNTLTITNNCWYIASGNWYYWNNAGGATLATWNALTGVGTDLNSDPTMTDPAAQDFTLQITSPCINAGTDVSLSRDYAGNSVLALPDIGAYEHQGAEAAPSQGSGIHLGMGLGMT